MKQVNKVTAADDRIAGMAVDMAGWMERFRDSCCFAFLKFRFHFIRSAC
jgi:hypothetical protein